VFEKELKNNLAQAEWRDGIDNSITEFVCDFFAFLTTIVNENQVKEIIGFIKASPKYSKPSAKPAQ
jgi:hypothetical protein